MERFIGAEAVTKQVSEVGKNNTFSCLFCPAHVFMPVFIQSWIFLIAFNLDIEQELTNFIILFGDKKRPKFLDDRLAEKLDPLIALCLVEEVEEQLPQFVQVFAHEITNGRHDLLAP